VSEQVGEQVGEQRRGIRADGSDLRERETRQKQGQSERRGDVEPDQRGMSASGQCGERGSVEDFSPITLRERRGAADGSRRHQARAPHTTRTRDGSPPGWAFHPAGPSPRRPVHLTPPAVPGAKTCTRVRPARINQRPPLSPRPPLRGGRGSPLRRGNHRDRNRARAAEHASEQEGQRGPAGVLSRGWRSGGVTGRLQHVDRQVWVEASKASGVG
jgi:hypothetical protein